MHDTQDVCRAVKLPIVLVPGLGKYLFSTALAAQKGVKTIFTKAGSIVDLGLFSIQLARSNNFDHLDLVIAKQSKRTESACCAISGKAFSKETVLTASIPQKSIAPSSAVCMNIDQRALGNGTTVGHNNDGPTYRILHNPTSTRSEVICCEKNNPSSSMMVDDIDKVSKSSDNLENVYDKMKNVETADSDNVGGNDVVKNQEGTLTLRFIKKSNGDVAGEKP